MNNTRMITGKLNGVHRLYVVTTAELWPTKIGYSQNPGMRLQVLQSGTWITLGLYATFVVDDIRFTEKVILDVMKRTGRQLSGEWCDMKADEMVRIIRLALKNKVFDL